MRKALIAWGGIFAAAVAGPVGADQLAFYPAKDNTLYQDDAGTISNGAGTGMFAGKTGTGRIRRAVLEFDLSGLPPGSTVTGAELTLLVTRTESLSAPASVHRLLADWGEAGSNGDPLGGGGDTPETGDATWAHRFYPDQPWASLGGDFSPAASATTTVGDDNSIAQWSGSGLAADVQGWLTDPASNHGWLIRGDESRSRTAKRFSTREAPEAERPRLTVVFTPPPGWGACCLAGGACELATAPDCAARTGEFRGEGAACSPNPCPQIPGSCCLPDGSCVIVTGSQCTAQGGSYRGAAACAGEACPRLTWACCLPSGACVATTAADCQNRGGRFEDGITCETNACPAILTPYVDPLPQPALAVPVSGTTGGAAAYSIKISQFRHQAHRDLPPTTMWGYGGRFPGPTITATVGQPVRVTWVNDLRDEIGNLRTTHLLHADPCVHTGGHHGAGPVIVTHLHGGRVGPESDGHPEAAIGPGESSAEYLYPNQQRAATLWYHDHALGITRLNVYLGLAGFYLLRDPAESALGLPSGTNEVPLIIQDRSFRADGSLRYPEHWHEHFFGEHTMVNGKVWPYFNVRKGKYRFRLLNGSNARVYTLRLSNGRPFHQIGTDGGLLPAPVELQELTLSPGERADVVIDFGGLATDTEVFLTNSAPAPFPGEPGVGVVSEVMKFRVIALLGHTAPLPAALRPVTPIPVSEAVRTRDLVLRRVPDACTGARWTINGLGWEDVTEFPRLGTAEVWRFINPSGMSHPMHLHLVQFQVLDRQRIEYVDDQMVPIGPALPAAAHEAGWKDTVRVDPGEMVRVIARFDGYTGEYPYHCHTLEHEDHDMMRRFVVVCPGDFDRNQRVEVADIFGFLRAWFAGLADADQDSSGSVQVADIFAFLRAWFAPC